MGRHIRKGIPYGGTVNDSRMVKHDDTTVGAKLDEIDSNLTALETKVDNLEVATHIDTSNVLQNATSVLNSVSTYTATEDCFVCGELGTHNGLGVFISINNVQIMRAIATDANITVCPFAIPLKAGQTFKLDSKDSGQGSVYTVYKAF